MSFRDQSAAPEAKAGALHARFRVLAGRAARPTRIRPFLVIIVVIRGRTSRQLMQFVCEENRVLIAVEVRGSNGLIPVLPLAAQLDEILSARAAQRSWPRDRATSWALSPALGNKRPAGRVQAEGHVVNAVEKGVQLGPQARRMVLVSHAADQQVGLDLASNQFRPARGPLRESGSDRFHCLLDRDRLRESLLQRMDDCATLEGGSDAQAQRPVGRAGLSRQPLGQGEHGPLVIGVKG